ncbi:hypothetical protein OS493_022426 [Desmophyllum pertusum]|uniref:Uncharacterized protein n=1 Tax=Desmophyllum pertusum TaxID=174260 RepID=A0A9W9ZNN8_9CNID|nr:hypothetical protein OS493_022426 [Desmophyllum pertusum]
MCFVSSVRIPTVYCIVLAVLLLPYADKPEGTILTTSAADNTVTQGDTVTFTCTVTAAKPQVSQYRFYLNDTLVNTTNDSKYTVNNVQRSQHYGKYTCIPHNDVGDGPEATVTLNVNVPVQFTVIPQNVTVNETHPIAVSCEASGFPAPSITWTKHGQGNPVIKEPNTQRSDRNDAGMYVCTANNGVGQAKTAITYVTVQYKPEGTTLTTSAADNTVTQGDTVTFTCTVTAAKPQVSQYRFYLNDSLVNTTNDSKYTVNNVQRSQHYGKYTCIPHNDVGDGAEATVTLNVNEKPGSPTITSSTGDIQATSLTVKWTPPADNGGSPITAYRVVILKDGIEIKNVNITNPGTTSLSVGDLERVTKYIVKVFARNAVFQGPAGQKKMKTKYEGAPATAEIYDLPSEVTNDTIPLKWREPKNNGKVITQYTVYQRIVTGGKQGEWTRLKTITDISVRELEVKLEKGKVYGFVVTATNELGESLKEDGKIKRVKASGIPAAVEMSDIPSEVTGCAITLRLSEPQSYGREITQYTVYQRIVTDGKPGEWGELKNITDVSVREWKVELEKGKVYEFVVTATNVHGESLKEEEKVKRVKAIGGSSCDEEKIILYAVFVSLIIILLIIILILGVFIWKMRKRLSK